LHSAVFKVFDKENHKVLVLRLYDLFIKYIIKVELTKKFGGPFGWIGLG
jgi:hypothetical protein